MMNKKEKVQDAIERASILKRIEELENAREEFAAQANQQIFGYNAVIGELKRLLEPATSEDEPQPEAEAIEAETAR